MRNNRNEEKLTAREIPEKDPRNMPPTTVGTTPAGQPIQAPLPKFDPNNIPTAGGFAPTLNPPPTQQPQGQQNPNVDEDEDEDEEEE
jgi:hypothetical protein